MCNIIYERYLLGKMYLSNFNELRAFKLNNCIYQIKKGIVYYNHTGGT